MIRIFPSPLVPALAVSLLIPALAFAEPFLGAFDVRIPWSNQVEIETNDLPGTLSLRTTGDDPYVAVIPQSDAVFGEEETVLAFEYFCPTGIDQLEIFHAPADRLPPHWSPDRSIEAGAMPKAEGWQPFAVDLRTASKNRWPRANTAFRLDFGRQPNVHLQIRNLHLRRPTEAEQLSAAAALAILHRKQEAGAALESYLNGNYPHASIERVSVTAQHVEIEGRLDREHLAEARLVEWQPHEEEWSPAGGTVLEEQRLDEQFSIRLNRSANNRDRLASRFSIAAVGDDKRRPLTVAHWANDVRDAAERDMPRLRPANRKALGGASGAMLAAIGDDLDELGMTAATVNVLLGRHLLVDAAQGIPFEHQGRTYFFNRSQVSHWDAVFSDLTKRAMVTSAILLIEPGNERLAHPEATPPGIYSMVDLTTAEAADTFRAILAFLAERYSRPDKKHGWISHWILFNEVDYGWTWTNMGEQTMAIYLEHYHRAMRLAWLEARRFNPTAEVFISLTHHWDYQPAEPMRVYAPRDLLDRLALHNALGGNFGWGVAHHPYPQNLFEARTWNDTLPAFRFSTPLITPKNIEVLVAYLQQEAFLNEGKPRTILLSEQGFHTPDTSEESFEIKAAAIAYMWKKIEPLDAIESFHYHRWVDHPHEGGLRLGLRTLPDAVHPFGVRKEPAFSILAAMETSREEAAAEPLKARLGISDWAEMQVPLDAIKPE